LPALWALIVISMLAVVAVAPGVGFVAARRMLQKDEAVDAATFLALRQLRQQFERLKSRDEI
jgi:type II secretory pathway pseudopilin PulG